MGRNQRKFSRGLTLKRRCLGYEKVHFTGHALQRMSQRSITREDVFHTIENPDAIGLPTAPGTFRVRWEKTDVYGIDVVYAIGTDAIRVVTAIKISKDAEKGQPPKILRVKKQQRKQKKRRNKPRRGRGQK